MPNIPTSPYDTISFTFKSYSVSGKYCPQSRLVRPSPTTLLAKTVCLRTTRDPEMALHTHGLNR